MISAVCHGPRCPGDGLRGLSPDDMAEQGPCGRAGVRLLLDGDLADTAPHTLNTEQLTSPQSAYILEYCKLQTAHHKMVGLLLHAY